MSSKVPVLNIHTDIDTSGSRILCTGVHIKDFSDPCLNIMVSVIAIPWIVHEIIHEL